MPQEIIRRTNIFKSRNWEFTFVIVIVALVGGPIARCDTLKLVIPSGQTIKPDKLVIEHPGIASGFIGETYNGTDASYPLDRWATDISNLSNQSITTFHGMFTGGYDWFNRETYILDLKAILEYLIDKNGNEKFIHFKLDGFDSSYAFNRTRNSEVVRGITGIEIQYIMSTPRYFANT